MVSAISSHYSRRHWYMCFTLVQNIGLVCCACLSKSVSSSTPHTHTLSKNSFGQARGSFNDIWVCGSSAGFTAGCVYTALLINSLSLSRRKCSRSGTAETHFWLLPSWIHVRVRVIGLSVGPVKTPQCWIYLLPSQAWGLSHVIGAVNLEEQRWYSWAQLNKDKQ